MALFSKEQKEFNVTINTERLTAGQIRLVKTIHAAMMNVLTSEEESEFFNGSAEFMRLCASLIKQANFSEKQGKTSGIPYAQQAVEYSIDILQEQISQAKLVSYDN